MSAPMERFLTTPIFAALLAVILILSGVTVKQYFTIAGLETDVAKEQAKHAETRAETAETLRDLAQRTADVAAKVRAREGAYLAAAAAADEQHRQERANALAQKDRVIADLRAGRLQLQPWWQCETTPATGDAADAAGPADPGGNARAHERRIEDSGRLVQIGIEADAKERWLRTELIATRALCGMGSP